MTDSPKKYGQWLAGAWREPEQGHYQVTNPATEEAVGYAPEGHAAEVWSAAEAARDAFDDWSRTEPRERAVILERIGSLISERADELVPLVQAETGATRRVAKSTVLAAADRFRSCARGALEPDVVPFAPHPVTASPLAPGGLIGATAVRRPVGVVACITSYTFSIANLAGKVAPALAMGNTVIAKPAAQDPLSCLELGPIMKEAGLPDGVYNLVAGSGPITGEALVAHYDTDMVSFTGSTAEGKRIAEAAGGQMKRTLMEFGGKGAAILLEDADDNTFKSAVMAVSSAFAVHSGQIRTAPTLMLVHRSLYEKAVAALTRYARDATVGDHADDSTMVGPVISAAQRDRVEAYVEGARQEGARVTVGGERPELKPGFYVTPTVLADVTQDMTVAQEEVFGPVVVVIPFDEEDEAVRIATGTPYGPYDYVFSGDTARAWHLAARLRSGNVGINTAQRHPATPFGNSSGLHAYSELQSVVWPS
ncbi:aldehyde dehydrogenase family protein [Streptomyces odonnellii]|uniref:aldehyde dehydrogenase family protein n=1 Tax=Streptomyces odonnellii TaxID=1417980 RepID=UPI000625D0DA|nr:aldehyde dehydrogenase family protein [Streptomyces odonnellii]